MKIDIVEQALSISVSIFDRIEQPLSISIAISIAIAILKIDKSNARLILIVVYELGLRLNSAYVEKRSAIELNRLAIQ
jgi:hypothetical protein